jgi:hypothetical protein
MCSTANGQPEATAFYIHGEIHKRLPRVKLTFHTHMLYAAVLSMTEGDPLIWAGQAALKFYRRTAVDRDCNGLARYKREGARIASAVGDADIVFMKHHGVMVLAPSLTGGLRRSLLSRAGRRGAASDVDRTKRATGQSRDCGRDLPTDARGGFRIRAAAPRRNPLPARCRGAAIPALTQDRLRGPAAASRAPSARRSHRQVRFRPSAENP